MPAKRHGQSKTRTYAIWAGMKIRCTNPTVNDWEYYGGRGIKICKRWHDDYVNFIEDMGQCPDGLTIDRIDNDGDYEPSNCRWASRKEQSENSRACRRLTLNHRSLTITEWSEMLGIQRQTIGYRINHGWTVREALTTNPGAPRQ